MELDVHLACQLRHAMEGVPRPLQPSWAVRHQSASGRAGEDRSWCASSPHVRHAFDAPKIGKGKAQPGIEQRLHIPPGKVGVKA